MKGKLIGAALLSLPLIAAGFVYASAQKPAQDKVRTSQAQTYICPVTGEELPCQDCCQLNSSK